MAADRTGTTISNTQILQELEALSESLNQSQTFSTSRRTASLALPRTSVPPISSAADKDDFSINPRPRSSRMSLSSWRSRLKLDDKKGDQNKALSQQDSKSMWADDSSAVSEKKGIWSWKPMRALAHIGMQKLSCLFSVEVVSIQGLPAAMNGLRLSVCVRKKESKDGAVQTMPSRVSQGAADFEETLFIRCHVYFTPGSGTHMKFEPRPFLIYVVAVDAEELDFGRRAVDLSGLIQESVEKSFEGVRIRQWDKVFGLSGKARGGELVVKLGFQIMQKDGGIGIYGQGEGKKTGKSGNNSSSVARKQSKTSFSVPSPRISGRAAAWIGAASDDLHGIDDLNLDEPEKPETKTEENDLPDFDVVEKGVEIQGTDGEEEEQSEENYDKRSVSSEVVKQVVQDQLHYFQRLTELDSIAQQIRALESMIENEKKGTKTDEETGSQALDAEEDKVTRRFLQMLEEKVENKLKNTSVPAPQMKLENDENAEEVFVPDLGKGLGCVVQTRHGGFLAAVNPFEAMVPRKEMPKLAMQMSKPLVIQSNQNGFEMFQKMAGIGLEELASQMFSLMPIDELVGKTAEQIAFEGIASAIIQGRNKEGASSSAARTIAAVKAMVSAMNSSRKERVSTGIWNLNEDTLTVDKILAFSMQKIENMAVDGLKIQADIAEEEAPFDVSPLDPKTTAANGKVYNNILTCAIPVEDMTKVETDKVTISVVIQLRDPLRQYEAVGGPMVALIHAIGSNDKFDDYSEDQRYKVASLQVGGIKVRSSRMKNIWDSERQRLTALQWLVGYGIGKGGKKGKRMPSKGPDILWSISSRTMADMWLKQIRNPDVKFTE